MIRRPSTEPARPQHPGPGPSQVETTWLLAGLAILALVLRELFEGLNASVELPDVVVTVAICGLIVAAVISARAAGMALERRHSESESFGRIVRALSRAVTSDEVVRAVIYELRMASEADHLVVARVGPGGSLDVTFVSTLPGASPSRTTLQADAAPGSVLARTGPGAARAGGGAATSGSRIDLLIGEEPAPASPAEGDARAQAVAERIASRVRDVYGLHNTLAAPLRSGGAAVGAMVVSRRTGEVWPEAATGLLRRVAIEASAALDRVRTHEAVESEARTDALTGVGNRRFFDEYVRALANRRRSSDRLAVLSADIDHFKQLNDQYGHQVGDAVLRAVAGAIVSSIREGDVPVRYGGEEFVVLVRDPTEGVPVAIGERMRQSVRALDLSWAGVTRPVTISVGVASGSPDEAVGEILERADQAMYAAKRAGRARVVEAWQAHVAR